MSKTEQQIMSLIGVLVGLFGIYVMIGWLLANPFMVKISQDSAAVVFNTAICFTLSGIWLTTAPALDFNDRSSKTHWFMVALALFVTILPILVLVEIVADLDLKIDWFALHRLVLDQNPHPGRMAPNTCFGFIFVGAAFLLERLGSAKTRRFGLFVCGFLVLLLGGSSLLGYGLDLDWLYRFAQHNHMAFMTAAGLSLIGIVLILAGQSSSQENPLDTTGEDSRLTRIAAIILICLSLASGLTGFLVLKRGTDQALRDELQQKAVSSADYFSATLAQSLFLTDQLLSFPVLANDLVTLPLTPDNAAAREHLTKVATILMNLGFSGLRVEDAAHQAIFSLGEPAQTHDLVMPIAVGDHDVSLFWDHGLVMHVEKQIMKQDAVIGTIVTEQRLAPIDKLLEQMRLSGRTTDVGLCAREDDFFNCFPSRFVTHNVHVGMFVNGQPAFPMAHALQGETGILYANDIRGIPVLAAYTPVGTTGLGLVVKIETTEIYNFIRQRLDFLLVLLALFVASGISILRARLQPLASRLVRSEQRMRQANEILEQDTERLSQIISVQNRVARSPMNIAAAYKIIVEQVEKLTHASGAVVEIIQGDELYYRATSGAFADYVGFRLKVAGSLSGHCIMQSRVLRCDDTEEDPRTDKKATRALNIRSMIVAPLLNEGTVIGVLKAASARVNGFDVKDEQALELLSGLLGSIIGHQQDYDAKQRLLAERTKALADLHQTTSSLRASEERTRVIIESAYDAFIAMDGEGRVTDWNRQATSILGWTRAEAIGQKLATLIVPLASLSAYDEYLALVLTGNIPPADNQRLELNVIRRTGESVVVEMTINPIRSGDTIMLAAFLHDITERTKIQQKMAHLAQYDALTHLPNRSLFMDRLSVAVLRAARNNKPMALMFLDLDGFKKINDHYGHQAGDQLLKQFADRLAAIVRKTDTVARLAGDEFTIILEELSEPHGAVKLVAGKIIQSMAEPFDIAGERLIMTTSIGIALGKLEWQNIDELIRHADAEMYKAKSRGKNQFSLKED